MWFRFHKALSDIEKNSDRARLPPATALAAASIDVLAASTDLRSEELPNYFGTLIA